MKISCFSRPAVPARERGATLIVGLIVLMLITGMVASAFKFSTFNLKAVGNMQARNEAVSAANVAIETVLGSWNFASAPQANPQEIDIDNDSVADYSVAIAAPVCIRSTTINTPANLGSAPRMNDAGLLERTETAQAKAYNVLWDIAAVATNSRNKALVQVHQGVSKTLSQTQCNAACPPSPGAVCS